jgi:hypothetical protein
MGLKGKTPERIDGMILHVRYEILKLINFITISNKWVEQIEGLPTEWAQFASESMLEAANIHMRNIVEFLQDAPKGQRVGATDYVADWFVADEDRVEGKAYGQLHGRVAHLSLDRLSVATEGDFIWSDFLVENVPKVLRNFRRFLTRVSPHHAELFAQPLPNIQRLDVVRVIDWLIGEE